MSRAGIIVHNREGNSVLCGITGEFGSYGNSRSVGYLEGKTVQKFIKDVKQKTGINEDRIISHFNTIYPEADREGILERAPRNVNENIYNYIIRTLLPYEVVNPERERWHLVDTGHSIRFCSASITYGYPKGGREGDESILRTALREFQEEVGYNFDNIEEDRYDRGKVIEDNKLYDIGTENDCKFYYMRVNNARAEEILRLYKDGYAYQSELFDLQFRPVGIINELINELASKAISRTVNGQELLRIPEPEPAPAAGGGGGSYLNPSRRREYPPPTGPPPSGPRPGSYDKRGGSIYLYKLQKYQNKLNKN